MKLTETQLNKLLDKLKEKIITGEAFEKDVEALYVRLQKARQTKQIIRVYAFLQLFLAEEQTPRLYHPLLVQAFYEHNFFQKAQDLQRRMNYVFPAEQCPLPPYTPMIFVSKYAQNGGYNARPPRPPVPLKKTWRQGIRNLTCEGLAQNDYFNKCSQIQKAPPKIRALLQRDFDELMLNYLFGNYKAVIILSGSVLETLLIYRLKKMKVRQIKCKKPGHFVSKQLLDSNLNDLLAAAAEYNLIPPRKLKLSRAARIYRNLVHPGRELSEKVTVNANKAEICFLCVLEMTDSLL